MNMCDYANCSLMALIKASWCCALINACLGRVLRRACARLHRPGEPLGSLLMAADTVKWPINCERSREKRGERHAGGQLGEPERRRYGRKSASVVLIERFMQMSESVPVPWILLSQLYEITDRRAAVSCSVRVSTLKTSSVLF